MSCSVHQFAGPDEIEDGTKDLCAVCKMPRYSEFGPRPDGIGNTPAPASFGRSNAVQKRTYVPAEAERMLVLSKEVAEKLGFRSAYVSTEGDYPVRWEAEEGPTLYLTLELDKAERINERLFSRSEMRLLHYALTCTMPGVDLTPLGPEMQQQILELAGRLQKAIAP